MPSPSDRQNLCEVLRITKGREHQAWKKLPIVPLVFFSSQFIIFSLSLFEKLTYGKFLVDVEDDSGEKWCHRNLVIPVMLRTKFRTAMDGICSDHVIKSVLAVGQVEILPPRRR